MATPASAGFVLRHPHLHHPLIVREPRLLEDEAEETRAMAIAFPRAEYAEEGGVREEAQPPPARRGEPEEAFDAAHAGEDLDEEFVW